MLKLRPYLRIVLKAISSGYSGHRLDIHQKNTETNISAVRKTDSWQARETVMKTIMSATIVIYFAEWIKSVILINLIVLLLLVYVVYIGI